MILAHREGEKKGFIVHGFAEPFRKSATKLDCECIKDGYRWTVSIGSIIHNGSGCPKCYGNVRLTEQIAMNRCTEICKEMDYKPLGFPENYNNCYSRFEYVCQTHGKKSVRYNDFISKGSRCGGCARDANVKRLRELGNGNGYFPERANEKDFLYVLNFNNKFIKVGRSFDIDERLKSLRTLSKTPIKKIYKLRIFTATHQEIYDYEQELHGELRERNFQYFVDWSTECFENDSLFILNKLLDNCGLEKVN